MPTMFSDQSRYAVSAHAQAGGEYIEYGRSVWLVSSAVAAEYRAAAAAIREREATAYAAVDEYTAGDPDDWRYRGLVREACVDAHLELLGSMGCEL